MVEGLTPAELEALAAARAAIGACDLDEATRLLDGVDEAASVGARTGAAILAARLALLMLSDERTRAAIAAGEAALSVAGPSASAEQALELSMLRVLSLLHTGEVCEAGEDLERLIEFVDRCPGVDVAALRSEAMLVAAMAAEGNGQTDAVRDAIDRALEAAAFSDGADRRCECFAWRAGYAMAHGRWREARNDIDAAIIALRAGASPLVAAGVRIGMAGLLSRMGALDEAAGCLAAGREHAERVPRLALNMELVEAELAGARGDLARSSEVLTRARDRAEQDRGSRRLLMSALLSRAELASLLGQPRAALTDLMTAAELADGRAPREEVSAWLRRAAVAVEFTALSEVEPALAGALGRARQLEDRRAQAYALTIAAEIEVRRGRLPAAASTLREGIALCEIEGDEVGVAELYRRHAEIAMEMGDLRSAESGFQAALEAAAAGELAGMQAQLRLARGLYRERRGDYRGALHDFRSALRALEDCGNPAIGWTVWLAIGSLFAHRLRRMRRGRVIIEIILERADRANHSVIAAEARLRLAATRAFMGEVDVAHDLLVENIELFAAIGDRRRHAESLARLADLFITTLSSMERGKEIFEEVALILQDSGDVMQLVRCHRDLGSRCALLLDGRYEEELFETARQHFQAGLDLTKQIEAALPRVDLLLDLGDLLLARRGPGDIDHARTQLEQARKLAAQANQAGGLARYEASRARLAAAREVFREALQHFEIARERYDAVGDMAGVFRVERARAEIHLLAGERNRAELSLKRALAMAERMGSLWDQRMTYHALHNLKSQLGDFPAAARLAAKSRELDDAGTLLRYAEGKLRLYHRLGIKEGMHDAMVDLIAARLDADDREAARDTLNDLQASCQDDPASQALAYRQLGDLFADRGDPAEADSWYLQAFEAVRTMAGPRAAAQLAEGIVGTLDELQDSSGVDRWLARALETASELGKDRLVVDLYVRAGTYYRSRARYDDALEHLKEGLQRSRELKDLVGEVEIAIALGDLHRDLARYREAVAWFEIAERVSRAEDGDERQRDLALEIAGCHALASASAEDEGLPEHEVEGLRRQARTWLEAAVQQSAAIDVKGGEPSAQVAGDPAPVPSRRGDTFEPMTPLERRAQVTSKIGEIYFDLDDEELARKQFEIGARLLEQGGFPGRQGDYLATVGDRFREHEVWGSAAAWYRRSFFAYLSAGEPERALEVAADIGSVYLDAGDAEMAVSFCEEAANRLGAEADADILGRLAHLRARLERRASGTSVALRTLHEAVGYLHSAGDVDRVVEVYDDIAAVHRRSGEDGEAIHAYKELLELVGAQEDPQLVAMIHSRIGTVHRDAQEYEEALRWFEGALEVVRQSGNEYATAGSLEDIALTHLDADQMDLALSTFGKVLEIYHRLEDLREIAWAHLWCCDIYLRMGDTASARKRARLSENIFKSQRMTPALIEAVIWVAQCDNAEGDHEVALEGLQYALARTKVLPRDEDKVRPARFLLDIFTDLGEEDLALDCARLLDRLGVEPDDLDDDLDDEETGDEYPDEPPPY